MRTILGQHKAALFLFAVAGFILAIRAAGGW